MIEEQSKKDIFQLSTHYNQFPTFSNTLSEPAVNVQYKQFIIKAKTSIIKYASQQFQQIKNHIIRQQISRINPFYSTKSDKLQGVSNLKGFIQNLLSFYRKHVQKVPINSQLIQQTQEFLEEVGNELQKRRQQLISDSDAVKNIQRTSYIVIKTIQKLIECLESYDLKSTDYYKYGEILKCLLRQLEDIIESSDFLDRISVYDPYSIPTRKDPMAETIKHPIISPRSHHTIKSQKSNQSSKQPHFYPAQKIHFDKQLSPSALDFIYPTHHRIYLCEAAKAYSDIVPLKINKINVDRFPKMTNNFCAFEINTDDYFSGEQTVPMIYHLIPHSNKMSFYKLDQMNDLLSLTKQYETIKQIPIQGQFSEDTRSCISPYGTIFIVNTNTKGNNYDLDFWQFKFNDNVLKKRAPIPVARKQHGMVFLNNFVFLIGGSNSTCKALKTVQKYNVKKKQWVFAGQLHVGVNNPTTCVFKNRYILSCCGMNEFDFISNRFEVYDSINDAWSILKTAVNLQQKAINFLNGGSAVVINSDVIYVFGGIRNTNFQHDTDFGILLNQITEIKKKPSRISADLIPTGGQKRVILSYAGNFKPNSGVIHKNSIYSLRKDIF